MVSPNTPVAAEPVEQYGAGVGAGGGFDECADGFGAAGGSPVASARLSGSRSGVARSSLKCNSQLVAMLAGYSLAM